MMMMVPTGAREYEVRNLNMRLHGRHGGLFGRLAADDLGQEVTTARIAAVAGDVVFQGGSTVLLEDRSFR
jgi:hypothetical protein